MIQLLHLFALHILFTRRTQYLGKTGARGLRTILEQVLLDTMYDLPSMDNVRKVVIDENVIVSGSKPYMIFDAPEAIAVSE